MVATLNAQKIFHPSLMSSVGDVTENFKASGKHTTSCPWQRFKAGVCSLQVPKLAATTVSKEELQGVFSAFASFGSRPASQSPGGGGGAAELDGAKFAKLCRDSQLLEHGFNSTSADIIFSRVKAKVPRSKP